MFDKDVEVLADIFRANLCRLLAIITRRKHVKPFRLQMLYVGAFEIRAWNLTLATCSVDLSKSFVNETALSDLLEVCRECSADIVAGEVGADRPYLNKVGMTDLGRSLSNSQPCSTQTQIGEIEYYTSFAKPLVVRQHQMNMRVRNSTSPADMPRAVA